MNRAALQQVATSAGGPRLLRVHPDADAAHHFAILAGTIASGLLLDPSLQVWWQSH
jgi:hypothetical protein